MNERTYYLEDFEPGVSHLSPPRTISEEEAIKWITSNPAKAIGILDQTGTLEAGKRADVVLWSADPFSIYAQANQVWIDGALTYDRHDPRFQPRSDFQLGMGIR